MQDEETAKLLEQMTDNFEEVFNASKHLELPKTTC